MKKSEFKEYLKTEILRMQEATAEDVKNQQAYNAELEKTKELEDSLSEYKVTKSEFKEYLKQEILREMELTEAPDDDSADIELDGEDVSLDDLEGEDINAVVDPGESDKALTLDDIGDTLVQLARKAKDVDERELANQILNSAKFAKKTEFKKIEKDAGVGEEEA
jgi:DNA topoisomerase VI subunit B